MLALTGVPVYTGLCSQSTAELAREETETHEFAVLCALRSVAANRFLTSVSADKIRLRNQRRKLYTAAHMLVTATLPADSVCETLSSSERKARAWLSTNILALRNTTWPRPDASLQSQVGCREPSVSGKWAQVQVYSRSPDDPTRSASVLSNTTERCTHSRAFLVSHSLIPQWRAAPTKDEPDQPANKDASCSSRSSSDCVAELFVSTASSRSMYHTTRRLLRQRPGLALLSTGRVLPAVERQLVPVPFGARTHR